MFATGAPRAKNASFFTIEADGAIGTPNRSDACFQIGLNGAIQG
ncbi:hypothetical protein ACVWXM_001445 [Bradyrhizobium sp. GM7.3]